MELRHAGLAGIVCLVAVGFAAAGCTSSPAPGISGATAPVTVSRTPASAPNTTTPSTTAPTPAAESPSSAGSPSAPSNTGSAAGAVSASSVVTAYFNALNAHDYQQAWALGGDNLGQSYSQFVAGFADTVEDSVTILSTSGDAVDINLVATQSDGTTQDFTGSYTVHGASISGASISQVGGAPPAGGTCGAPSNPYGYTLCDIGTHITSPASGVCSYFDCIDNFWNGRGYMVECKDGSYSMSGGIDEACSDHGGESRAVYSGG